MDESDILGSKDKDLLRAYRSVFSNPAGALVLRHLEGVARVRHSTTEEEQKGLPIDPVKLQIHEGMRRVYWKIRTQIAAADHLLGEG